MVVRPFELTHGPEVLEGQDFGELSRSAQHTEPAEGESRTPPGLNNEGPDLLRGRALFSG